MDIKCLNNDSNKMIMANITLSLLSKPNQVICVTYPKIKMAKEFIRDLSEFYDENVTNSNIIINTLNKTTIELSNNSKIIAGITKPQICQGRTINSLFCFYFDKIEKFVRHETCYAVMPTLVQTNGNFYYTANTTNFKELVN